MIVRSPYPDVEIPERSFPEHVLRFAAEWRDKPALIDAASGRMLTFGQLDDSVRRAASGLLSLGLRRGDVVALYAPNSPDYAVVVHAVLRVGGVCTTINPRYSSGTTGHPKGVMLTHFNLVANMSQYDGCLDVDQPTDEDTIIAVLPFFHIYGFRVYLGSAISHGATMVTLPRFEINMFLQTIQEFRVTRLYAVPPILLAIVNSREACDYDLSSLRHIACGAAPLDEALATAAVNRLKCTLVQGYGLTETTPMTHFGRGRGKFSGKVGSSGVCAPNTEAKIIDCETGLDLGVRQQGELLVRGPQVMQGYLARPAETAATIDEDGWLHTGDVAYFDEDGDFFVVDRVKELIKYKGLQVAPAELEALLLTHPGVMDAAVVPCPDDEAGDVPVAYVVAHEPLDAEEVMTFVASRVAPHKRIRRVECVAEIPKSPSGKILRRVLVERERARR